MMAVRTRSSSRRGWQLDQPQTVAPLAQAEQLQWPEPYVLGREGLRLVLFGDPGTGKTTLASMFPNPLFVDTDGGMVSAGLAGAQALRFVPKTRSDLERLYAWAVQNEAHYDTLVIDSFTELQRMVLTEIVDESAGKSSGGSGSRSILDFVPEQAEYLATQNAIFRLLAGFKRLSSVGKHVVMTCGVRERGIKRTPDMSPGLLQIVDHWASVTAEVTVAKADNDPSGPAHRWMWTEPSPTRDAKTRFAKLGPVIWLPPLGAKPNAWDLIDRALQDSYAEAAAIAGATTEIGGTK